MVCGDCSSRKEMDPPQASEMDSDPALNLLKAYVDQKIDEKVTAGVQELHKNLQEVITDAFQRTKNYVKMHVDRAQREAGANLNEAMKTMWENVEKEFSRKLQLLDYKEISDNEDAQNLDLDIEESDLLEKSDNQFLDLSQIEEQRWGKNWQQPSGSAKRVSAGEEDSPLKTKKEKKPAAPRVRNRANNTNNKGSKIGRPPGSKNQIYKSDLQDQKDLLEQQNAALKKKVQALLLKSKGNL